MIKLINSKLTYSGGKLRESSGGDIKGTVAYNILSSHNIGGDDKKLKLKFDYLASHDITYVGIIQTAKGSGLTKFPVPYVLTNCHNSLCAVGGTINEDDHLFGLSAAKKYGGIYVPPHIAVIHTYMREMWAAPGKMILGSDSHTRYGALGTLAVGEGGPELVKQIVSRTYDVGYPEVIAVELKGRIKHGVGPQDVALAIIGATFKNGFVKNKVMEFIGDGIDNLPIEFRNGIDVMTTETACLSSIWKTDGKVKEYLASRGRADMYKELKPQENAGYDGAVVVELDKIEPMIALPFHPSNVYKLKDLINNPEDILSETEKEGRKLLGKNGVGFSLLDKIVKGKIKVGQGIIAGCAGGTYDNIALAANIMRGFSAGSGEFSMSVYPSSQPIYLDLIKKGVIGELMSAGAIVKTAFCGPCFGAGDVPANNTLSIRHTTRNFENREGSVPTTGQIAAVALMDSRSIAATCRNGGILTSAADIEYSEEIPLAEFSGEVYNKRVYNGYGKPENTELKYGPNIADWPKIEPMNDNLLLEFAAAIYDPVTTTDELIPSGETSSYRSNPLKLASFALSRKDPEYVGRAKKIAECEKIRSENKLFAKEGDNSKAAEFSEAIRIFGFKEDISKISFASAVYAVKPGDGSAREQAASVQRVLGGGANAATEYATKRYRSNLINWGILPLLSKHKFKVGDMLLLKNIKESVATGKFDAALLSDGKVINIDITMDALTEDEKKIILSGCLMNYYAEKI